MYFQRNENCRNDKWNLKWNSIFERGTQNAYKKALHISFINYLKVFTTFLDDPLDAQLHLIALPVAFDL